MFLRLENPQRRAFFLHLSGSKPIRRKVALGTLLHQHAYCKVSVVYRLSCKYWRAVPFFRPVWFHTNLLLGWSCRQWILFQKQLKTLILFSCFFVLLIDILYFRNLLLDFWTQKASSSYTIYIAQAPIISKPCRIVLMTFCWRYYCSTILATEYHYIQRAPWPLELALPAEIKAQSPPLFTKHLEIPSFFFSIERTPHYYVAALVQKPYKSINYYAKMFSNLFTPPFSWPLITLFTGGNRRIVCTVPIKLPLFDL